MENFDKMDTPKKRYSCTSEYATPKGSDDSDCSLYYSFIESLENCIDDDDVVNKENSVGGSLWTITDTLDSPTIPRVPKVKTPLLRKILQTNHTPRNKNNKRVSFSHLSKPSPTPTTTLKVSKAKDSDTINLHSGENLPITSNEKQIEQKNERKSENVEERNAKNDESVSSDVTDDLENELHNTIIENLKSPAANETLVLNSEEHVTSTQGPYVSQTCTMPIILETIKSSESNEMHSSSNQLINDLTTVASVRTIEQIIEEARKNISQTRNANDNRKSILPITKKATRATTYKRRSSTYEPRIVDSRKSLGILKQIAKKVGGKHFES